MKFIEKFFKKNHELTDEQRAKFNSMVQNDNTYDNKENISFESLILNLHTFGEINRIRNLLDKRQEEIENGSSFLVESEIKNSSNPEFENINYENVDSRGSISEVQVEEALTDSDIDYETYQDDFEKENDIIFEEKKDDTPIPLDELKETSKVQTNNFDSIEEDSKDLIFEEEKSEEIFENNNLEDKNQIEINLFLEKIKGIFYEENILYRIEEKSNLSIIDNKKLVHIGVREKDKFGEDSDPISENAWFIGNIKQLDDLKYFKMLKSDKGMKDLLWDKGEYAIIISFRATTFLSSINEFDFDI